MCEFERLIDLAGHTERQRPCIAVAAAEHEDTQRCLSEINKRHLADALLFGDRAKILQIAARVSYTVTDEQIIDAKDHEQACALAVTAVKEGRAHILMKGIVHTSVFGKSLLDKSSGLVLPDGLISHLGLFDLPYYHKPLFVTDAAINIAPDVEKKRSILFNALHTMRRMGIQKPKVAVIGPVETVNPKIPSTMDAMRLVKEQQEYGVFGDCEIEGPYAIDVALSARAAAIKGIVSGVAGNADLLLCPNLDTANAVNKLMILVDGCRSAGIVVGLSVPVVLTSRSDTDMNRFYSICMAIRSML